MTTTDPETQSSYRLLKTDLAAKLGLRAKGGITYHAPQALTWLLKAANHDVIDAQYNAALMYLTGDGIYTDT